MSSIEEDDIVLRTVRPLVQFVLWFEPFILPAIVTLIVYKASVYFLFTNWNKELYKACKDGNISKFRECVKNKADLLSRHEENGILPIMIAALNGHSEIVKESLAIRPEIVKEKDYQEKSVLRYACENLHFDIIKMLVAVGTNAIVDTKCHNGMTPLILAAKAGRCDIVEFFINNKSDVKWKNSSGFSALTITVDQVKDTDTCIKILKLLLDNGASIESKTFSGWTALIKASSYGNIDIVKFLIEYGKADINAVSSNGFTALLAACQGGYEDIFDYLVSLDKKTLTAVTKDGTNAFVAACFSGNMKIIRKIFEDDNSIINSKFNQDNNCLMLAISNNNDELCNFLLENNIDIFMSNKNNVSALTIAVQNGNNKIAEKIVLLDNENKLITQTTKTNWTVLMYACLNNMIDIVELILERDISTINNIQSDGWSALAMAVISDYPEMTELLCHYGADVDITINPLALFEKMKNSVYQRIKRFKCDQGVSACPLIIVAIIFEHFDIIKILCSYDVDLFQKNYGRYNAFDIAKYSKRSKEILNLLKERKKRESE